MFSLDEFISIKALYIMKADQVHELLKKYPMGIRLLFLYNLEIWQKSKENDLMPNCPSTSSNPSNTQTVDLGEVLKGSNTGTMIIEFFKTNNKLNDGIRSILVETIINYLITNKISMSVHLAEQLANNIVAMFPTEIKVSY